MKQKEFLQRGLLTVGLALCGVFLGIRAKAFFLQAWRIEIGRGWVLAAAALACVGGVFSPVIVHWGERRFRLPLPALGAAAAAAVLLLFAGKSFLLTRPLEGTEIVMGRATRLAYLAGAALLLWAFLCCALRALADRRQGAAAFLHRVNRWNWVFLLILLLVSNVWIWLYAKNSQVIYYWDNAGYWTTSHTLAQQWQEEGLVSVLRGALDSVLTQDYNDLIVLPAVAAARLFGRSRYVFLATIGNCWFVPLALLVWGLCKSRLRHSNWLAGAVLLSMPMLFYNVLIGFIDVGGCVPALGAMLLWLSDREERDFGRFFLCGLCLAGAVLLRRWFAFYAVAFLLALAVDCLIGRRSPAPFLGALSSFSFTLLYFFQTLVSNKLMADYGSLYEAYQMGLKTDFLLLFRYFGIAMAILTLGIAAVLTARRQTRRQGIFLVLQPLLCFIIFVRVQSHGQQHLLLYAPAALCLLILGLELLQSVPVAQYTAAVLAAAVFGLSPCLPRIQPASLAELVSPSILPSFSWKPARSETALDAVALIRALDVYGEEGDQVGLLASSLLLNRDLLLNAEASLSLEETETDRSYLAALPAVDQRDGWADTLFYCDILVVADPIQTHLGEENQQVLVIPARHLLEGTGFADAYEELDETWSIGEDIKVHIYRKVRDLTEEEQQALRAEFSAVHPELSE